MLLHTVYSVNPQQINNNINWPLMEVGFPMLGEAKLTGNTLIIGESADKHFGSGFEAQLLGI